MPSYFSSFKMEQFKDDYFVGEALNYCNMAADTSTTGDNINLLWKYFYLNEAGGYVHSCKLILFILQ